MIRLAIVGRNFVVDRMLEAAEYVPEIKLSGICSRTKKGADEFAAKYGIDESHRYVGLKELCRADDIDAVYIASPNIMHEEQAMRLLESGKHVLAEKPAAVTAAGFERMCTVAGRSGVVLMEAMTSRYMPGTAVIKRLVGKITPIRRGTFSYLQYSSRYDKFKSGIVENAFNPAMGGGALMDIGVYCAALAEDIFGTPKSINAEAVFLENGLDGEGTALMMYSGMMVELMFSKITDSLTGSQICGEGGCVMFDSVSRPHIITLRLRSGETHTYDASRLDTERFDIKKLGDEALASIETGEGGFAPLAAKALPDMTYELRHFAHLAESRSLLYAKHEQAHTISELAILDGIRKCLDITY